MMTRKSVSTTEGNWLLNDTCVAKARLPMTPLSCFMVNKNCGGDAADVSIVEMNMVPVGLDDGAVHEPYAQQVTVKATQRQESKSTTGGNSKIPYDSAMQCGRNRT